MQCKDIPDIPILVFLKEHPQWCTWGDWAGNIPTVAKAMPLDTLGKLQLAKMRMLIRRGLVDGCDCGCRGDFVITDKGLKFLEESTNASHRPQ